MGVLERVAGCIGAIPFAQKAVAHVDTNVHSSFAPVQTKEGHKRRVAHKFVGNVEPTSKTCGS